ncbi:MAG TPA: ATPase [Bacteroidota bacterium]|nr:ATPase [Bacteroidota bacterium]
MTARLPLIAPTLLVLTFCIPNGSSAEVIDSSAIGFTVKNTVEIASSPADVYNRVVHDVGGWWNPAHTYSGDAHNLSIDGIGGGCFCEKLSGGGSVRHMTVIYAAPGKVLRMDGALGPLQPMAVTGTMTLSFTGSGTGTKLELTYTVGGYTPHGLQRIAPAADRMLGEQIGRLKSYIETGNPAQGEKK